MFNASYFTYDGVSSAYYGLQIAEINSEHVEETTFIEPELAAFKTSRSKRFFYNGTTQEVIPQYQFSIISPTIIDDSTRRNILKWLIARNGFKNLVIHQRDLEQYTYKCIFTNVDIIYINGYCYGFRITANFDSAYAYGTPTVVTASASGSATTLTINNGSDIDGYVYPEIQFTPTSATGTKAISIYNTTDSVSREFAMFWYDATSYPDGIVSNETVTVDNELHIINSSSGGEKLGCFNKNWLRLRPGTNTLTLNMNGSATITCPTYVMIGF